MTITKVKHTIKQFYLTHHRLPTYEELQHLLGFASKRTGFTWVQKLINAGILKKDIKGKLIPHNLFAIPYAGTIQAGYPSEATQDLHQTFDPYSFICSFPLRTFSLVVTGDSMIDAGIHEGDIVVIDKDKRPRNGDIVAALLDGEYTLKYFYKKDNIVILRPANKLYPPLIPTHSLSIAGVVIHSIRTYR